jgi:MtN3 and saliva related transmembrane protein
MNADLIGYFAATLTTVSFVPQVWLIWRTRCVDGVSLAMYALFTTGIALWLVYGLLTEAGPLVAANAVTLLLSLSILLLKLRHQWSQRDGA